MLVSLARLLIRSFCAFIHFRKLNRFRVNGKWRSKFNGVFWTFFLPWKSLVHPTHDSILLSKQNNWTLNQNWSCESSQMWWENGRSRKLVENKSQSLHILKHNRIEIQKAGWCRWHSQRQTTNFFFTVRPSGPRCPGGPTTPLESSTSVIVAFRFRGHCGSKDWTNLYDSKASPNFYLMNIFMFGNCLLYFFFIFYVAFKSL